MKKILVIGSTVADIIINVDYLPSTTQDVHVISEEVRLGGCAYNVSDMIRHFGAPYILYSPVGTGMYGDFVRKSLSEKGITPELSRDDMKNGCCYCFVESSGERTFISNHGAEYLFKKEWFDRLSPSEISGIYICGLEIEDKTGDVIVDFLEANADIPVFFAPGPRISLIDQDRMARILKLSPFIHLNRSEICEYTGCEKLEDAVYTLYEKTHNTIVVTDGEDGAYCFDGKYLTLVPPAKVPGGRVVDTIGAGDGHVGAVIANMALGKDIISSVEMANKASALVVSTKGATIPDDEFNLK